MSYLKSLIFVSLLLSQVAFAQKVDDKDPMGVIVPEGSYMFSFCLEKTSICGVKKPKKEVYSGMKGKLTSLSPVKVEYGKNNIFEIKMENGDFLYFDPPYLITFSDYNKLWGEDEERRLYKLLDELDSKGIKWGLSNMYNHKGKTNEILLEWGKKYNEYDIKSNYISRFDNTIKKDSKEIYITNYINQ